MALRHARSGEVVRLAPWRLLETDERTSAVLKAAQLEVVQVVLQAGRGLPEHRVPGEITVLCLSGAVDFRHAGSVDRMNAGDFMHLGPDMPHALDAVADAVLLVTISLQPQAGRAPAS